MSARFIISAARPEQFPPESEAGSCVPGPQQRRQIQPDECAGGGRRAGANQFPARLYAVDQFLSGRRADSVSSICQGMDSQKSPSKSRSEWKELIESYLLGRGALRLCGDGAGRAAGMDGKGCRAAGLARSPRAALRGGRHESGQVEDAERKASKPAGSPRRIRGRDARMLGRHRPGSEGNLASDLENQDSRSDDSRPNAEAAAEAPAAKPPSRRRPSRKPEAGGKPEPSGRRRKPAADRSQSRRRGEAGSGGQAASRGQAAPKPKPDEPKSKQAGCEQRRKPPSDPHEAEPEAPPSRRSPTATPLSRAAAACSTASAAQQGNRARTAATRSIWWNSRT